MKKKKKNIDYGKWGLLFILPFFIAYLIFSLIPLIDTVRYSFFEYYRSGIKVVGPNFVGMKNYISLLKSDMFLYGKNTLILWLIGFVPQIVVALVLACWFTDLRMKIHGKQFFKVVIYLPNLIMASAFALLFFTMFSTNGPVNSILLSLGVLKAPIDFLGSVLGTRGLIGFMNFMMWFGNTTIMLMAAVMGVSVEVYEAADLDGCNGIQRFFYITLPMIRPILAYTLITSIIGGLQMFDVPQILTNGQGNPDRTSMTLIMFSTNGPVNSILLSLGVLKAPIDFLGSVLGTRGLIGFMNFMMWFGNTTIMLMAAVMGVSVEVYEAADLDGCNGIQRFFYITLPMIRPILAYTLITSIIGGLQMFDVPQILTNGQGNPDRTSMTLIMFLNSHLKSKNYGMAGALSVYLFIISGILCFFVYRMTNDNDPDGSKKAAKKRAKEERRRARS